MYTEQWSKLVFIEYLPTFPIKAVAGRFAILEFQRQSMDDMSNLLAHSDVVAE